MTASIAKGAAAGTLLARAFEKVVGWVKEYTLEAAKLAARNVVELRVREVPKRGVTAGSSRARHVLAALGIQEREPPGQQAEGAT